MKDSSGLGRRRTWLLISLAVLTVLAYWPVIHCQFAGYDDELYVTGNAHVQSGLQWNSLVWAFTSTDAANWHPLTWISHLLDVELFGLNPSGHHLTSLLIHCINVLLVFLVLGEATGDFSKSGLVAAIFAVHPLNVESVAWVAERKSVLSMLFLLLAMRQYVKYTRRPNFPFYLSVVVFFSLSLLSKPMGVTFPFLLLLFDLWPLRRFAPLQDRQAQYPDGKGQTILAIPGKRRREKKIGKRQRAREHEAAQAPSKSQTGPLGGSNRRVSLLLLEKIPLAILSLASSLITLKAQKMGGAVQSTEVYSIASRIANASVSYAKYLLKMVWPADLAVFYPHPEKVQYFPAVVMAFAILLPISLAALVLFKRYPFVLVGWLWYLGTFVPMIGLVQVGDQAMADRYAYFPLLGIFILIVWTSGDLLKPVTPIGPQLPWLGLAVVVALSITTRWNLQFWKNGAELFSKTLRATGDNYVAYNGLGKALADKGEYDSAISNFQKALALKPNYGLARRNLAAADHNQGAELARRGRNEEALAFYTKALEIDPGRPEFHYDTGLALSAMGRTGEAAIRFKQALVLNPAYAQAYRELGSMLYQQGDADGAIANYLKSAEIRADYQTFYNLGAVFANLGKIEQAMHSFKEALKLKPGDVEARRNLMALGKESKTNIAAGTKPGVDRATPGSNPRRRSAAPE